MKSTIPIEPTREVSGAPEMLSKGTVPLGVVVLLFVVVPFGSGMDSDNVTDVT